MHFRSFQFAILFWLFIMHISAIRGEFYQYNSPGTVLSCLCTRRRANRRIFSTRLWSLPLPVLIFKKYGIRIRNFASEILKNWLKIRKEDYLKWKIFPSFARKRVKGIYNIFRTAVQRYHDIDEISWKHSGSISYSSFEPLVVYCSHQADNLSLLKWQIIRLRSFEIIQSDTVWFL